MVDARNYPASRIVQHYQSAVGRFADFTSLLALVSRGSASLHPGLYAGGRSAGFFRFVGQVPGVPLRFTPGFMLAAAPRAFSEPSGFNTIDRAAGVSRCKQSRCT
jgi:hypothetical protein